VKDISGKALRMDADDRRFGVDVTHDERHGGFDALCGSRGVAIAGLWIVDDAFESENPEMAPAGGKICVCNLFYTFKGHSLHYTNVGGQSFLVTKELQDNDETVTRKMQERKVKG
jgi:hypothetical protein